LTVYGAKRQEHAVTGLSRRAEAFDKPACS